MDIFNSKVIEIFRSASPYWSANMSLEVIMLVKSASLPVIVAGAYLKK